MSLVMLHLILVRFTDSLNLSGDNVLFNNNDKADCLNGYFASVFTVEDLNCLPSLTSTYRES